MELGPKNHAYNLLASVDPGGSGYSATVELGPNRNMWHVFLALIPYSGSLIGLSGQHMSKVQSTQPWGS